MHEIELTGRRNKIVTLVKLLAKHLDYLPELEKDQMKSMIEDYLGSKKPEVKVMKAGGE